MTAAAGAHHEDDSWTAAVYASAEDPTPIGSGVVISEQRILTCAHVIADRRDSLYVAFPKAGESSYVRLPVAEVRRADRADVAVLQLRGTVPDTVRVAALRSPHPLDLIGERWRAFGFPKGAVFGAEAQGVIGASLAHGVIRLDTDSRDGVRPGFSGAGLWSPLFQAVVGLVSFAQQGGAHPGDALALTVHQIEKELPGEELTRLSAWTAEAAGSTALAAWGWALDADPEGRRHWRPRARGVMIDTERGYRFRGRSKALTRLVRWLDRPVTDRRVLIVTGSPGVGKSAVLGRIVTTADREIRQRLPGGDTNVRATVDSVACAVHVKGKTVVDVAAEVARAASLRPSRDVEGTIKALRRALETRATKRFNLVIDALDEATSPVQARQIIARLIMPIAETCAGAQVVVGTRRLDDGGELLGKFGAGAKILDLDSSAYFDRVDLTAYALATLALVGDERPESPYADPAVAAPLAERIADMADGNFLIAGLVARTHGFYDENAVDAERLTFTPTVDAALATYLDRLRTVSGIPASVVLTALAYAEAPGISPDLWRVTLDALDAPVTKGELLTFVDSSAANFLIESTSEFGTRRFRLFHQALNDALRRERERLGRLRSDEFAVARGLYLYGRQAGWAEADPYLLRALPIHAQRAHTIDQLLADDEYLLHADLLRLTPFLESAQTEPGRTRRRLLQLTPQAVSAQPAERAALFSVTQALEQFDDHPIAPHIRAPYRAVWGAVAPRVEKVVLGGHTGGVRAICAAVADGRGILATASDDRTVRLWDPVTNRTERTLSGHGGPVNAICAFRGADRRDLLASGGTDGIVRIWDPATGFEVRQLPAHAARITGLCTIRVHGRSLLAAGDSLGEIIVWNPTDGIVTCRWQGHADGVMALSTLAWGGHTLLLTVAKDGAARAWNPADGTQVRTFSGHVDWVRAVCSIRVGADLLVATASHRTVRLWDIHSAKSVGGYEGAGGTVRSLCSVGSPERPLLAVGRDNGEIDLWNPQERTVEQTFTGHASTVRALCVMTMNDQAVLVSGSEDRTARIWDPAERDTGSAGSRRRWVNGLCYAPIGGREAIASISEDRTVTVWDAQSGRRRHEVLSRSHGTSTICATVVRDRLYLVTMDNYALRLWDPETRVQRVIRGGEAGAMRAMCGLLYEGKPALATAGHQRDVVLLWDPAKGRKVGGGALLRGRFGAAAQNANDHAGGIRAMCAIHLGNRAMLATAGQDHTARLWEARTGRGEHVFIGHDSAVNAICEIVVDGDTMLATGGDDRTVRIWSPITGQLTRTLLGHRDAVTAVCMAHAGGVPILVSASYDRTVRLWDPATGKALGAIPVHHPAFACVEAAGLLVIGMSAGIVAVRL